MTENTQQAYEVPGQQLKRRARQLHDQGFPFEVHPQTGGVYVVVVTQPAGVNPFAYQPAPQRQRASVGVAQLQVAAVVGILGAIGYVAYVALGGAASVPASVPGQLRQTLGVVMDAIGVALFVLLAAFSVWIARPLVAKAMSMGRRK